MKSLLRKGCLIFLIVIVVAAVSPFLWRGAVKLYYHRAILEPADVPQRGVAIVFGAAVYGNGRLSVVLRDRVDTAVALYRAGQVDQIIMSGDNRARDYDEPSAMMAYAVERGVDPADVVTDPAGTRTYNTCYRARHVFEVKQAVLVTQTFHLPRALMTCEGLGIDVVGAVADQQRYRGERWYELRETAATLVATWDVMRRNPPPVTQTVDRSRINWPDQLTEGN